MLDQTDLAILELLRQNARMQWREIGEIVHLTGQAVGNRIRKMEEMGVIKAYTVTLDPQAMGPSVTALVTIYMKSPDHASFLQFIRRNASIHEAHRISGEGCYLLRVQVSNQDELNQLLDEILHYANYRLHLSIGQVK